MSQVVLLLGSNMGNREKLLDRAGEELIREVGPIVRASKTYEAEPWGFSAPQHFLNRALIIETGLSPLDVLDKIQAIETKLGRIRQEEKPKEGNQIYQSRPIDIDILFYDDRILNSERLTIPHPLIAQREFVLSPLREIMGEYRHPVEGKLIRDL